MTYWITYDKSTGQIEDDFDSGPSDARRAVNDGWGIMRLPQPLPATDQRLHYVDVTATPKVVKERQVVEYGVEQVGLGVVITGLPPGLTVMAYERGSVNEEPPPQTTTDGEPLEIEFELPGTYSVVLTGLVPYLDKTLEVTVG